MKNRSLHLAALASVMLSSNALAASACRNTDFSHDLLPDAGADPLHTKYDGKAYISDGNSVVAIGGGAKAKTEFKHGIDLDISDDTGAGLPAKKASYIGADITLQHAAGLGTAASA